jgi:twitching motility two-component system response regulator PilG
VPAALSPALRDAVTAAYARQFDEARVLIQRAREERPDGTLEWFWTAIVAPDSASAIEALRRVLALDPAHAAARDALAKLLVAQAVSLAGRDRGRACALAAEASRVAPSLDSPWIALAALSDDPAQSLTALRRAVAVAPQRTELKTRLHDTVLRQAVLAAKAGRAAEARPLFREAASLDPKDVRTWQALARLAETPADAASALRELAKLLPHDAAVKAELARAETAAAPAPPPPVAVPRAAGTPARKTILVVDDSATIRKILTLTLEGAGYAVVAEPDGGQAIERLAQMVPDLILLDITMPVLDGYEVCKRIRKDARISRVPVVMLSGKDGFFDKVKGRVVGATEYLTKPFQAPAVLAVIARHCGAEREVAHG